MKINNPQKKKEKKFITLNEVWYIIIAFLPNIGMHYLRTF